MHKSLSYRILAIFMAFLMFFSSTGFSMDIHYCQDEIQTISLFGKAKSCIEMNGIVPKSMDVEVCVKDKDLTQLDRKQCCHNERLSSENLDVSEFFKEKIHLDNSVNKFLTAFVAVYIFKANYNVAFHPFNRYASPLPDTDIQILYQTFLI